jgi:addiction module HigA family antidote
LSIISITTEEKIMRMYNPPHPGLIIADALEGMGITITDAAAALHISRVTLSKVINGKSGVSADLAIRLSKWMTGPAPDTWLAMQADYDLWQLTHVKKKAYNIRRAKAPRELAAA